MQPVLNRRWTREVDHRAVEDYGMASIVLMENAGRQIADAVDTLSGSNEAVIACGKGNNAGDGFVVARHLDLRGQPVKVLLFSDPEEFSGDAAANYNVLAQTEVPIVVLNGDDDDFKAKLKQEVDGAAVVVDALLGTGAKGDPRPPLDTVIDFLNEADAVRVAVDIPSGLDCDSGEASKHTFRADHTLTFVALKPGFSSGTAKEYLGDVKVLDIGAPRKLIEAVVREAEQS